MKNLLTLMFMVAFIVLVVVAGPLLTIWALNTLFPVVAIPYTLSTWLAALILGAVFKSTVSLKK